VVFDVISEGVEEDFDMLRQQRSSYFSVSRGWKELCEYPGCGRKIKGKVNLRRYYQTTHLSLRLRNPSAGPSRVKCAELECDKTFVNKFTMANGALFEVGWCGGGENRESQGEDEESREEFDDG